MSHIGGNVQGDVEHITPPKKNPAGGVELAGGRGNDKTRQEGAEGRGAGSREPLPKNLRRQRGRLFHRLVTGMYFHRKKTFRFLTLTSSPSSPSMRSSWHELVRVIRKTAPIDFVGYLAGDDFARYPKMLEALRFEYFAVFTDEGEGVLHVIYVGDYIPFQWLQDQWISIHSAYGVNIKAVRKYSQKRRKKAKMNDHAETAVYYPAGLAGYVLRQYVANQSALRWHSHSRGWVYPGFVDDWRRIKSWNIAEGLPAVIKAWHEFLDNKRFPQSILPEV